jgi:hypothetical protein
MVAVNELLSPLVGQGLPLAPPLGTRIIALLVVEAVLLVTAALLYVRWVQIKEQPLDQWWAQRQAQGLQPRSRFLMEESEREQRGAEGTPQADQQHAAPPDT